MPLLDYTLWKDIGTQLQDFKYPRKYLTPEQYIQDNPLENLVVPVAVTECFGTKVCNIFIVAQPYGWVQSGTTWTESWPPEGLQDLIDHHKEMYEKFTWYETHIYMDFNIVNRIMEANPDSKFEEMMTAVKGHMEEICDELADFGFVLEEDITTEVDASFFQPVIDAFQEASASA